MKGGVIMGNFILKKRLDLIKIKLNMYKITQNSFPLFSERLKKNIDKSTLITFNNINEDVLRKLKKG